MKRRESRENGETLVNGEKKEKEKRGFIYTRGRGRTGWTSSNGAAVDAAHTRHPPVPQQLAAFQRIGAEGACSFLPFFFFVFVSKLRNNDFLIGRWSRVMPMHGIVLTSWLASWPAVQSRPSFIIKVSIFWQGPESWAVVRVKVVNVKVCRRGTYLRRRKSRIRSRPAIRWPKCHRTWPSKSAIGGHRSGL